MKIAESLDELRGRVTRLRRGRGYGTMALLMGISKLTLHNFLNGLNVTSASIAAIEQWCDEEEANHAEVTA